MNLAALSPAVREAAERFERETGRWLDDELPQGPVDEGLLGVFLIVNGYPPVASDSLNGASGPA